MIAGWYSSAGGTEQGCVMRRTWIALGALAGLTGVAMAALAAHGLGALAPSALGALRNAIEMQVWHALALLACGLWAPRGGRLADAAGAAFTIGIVLFSGGIYSLEFLGERLANVVPIGGMLLMAGWILLASSALVGGRRTRW
jgi:uncharacterized membrane protein YgdD (TMEM256/DUF423 family)